VLKGKVDEAATMADEGIKKGASAAKGGIDVASEKTKEGLEYVTEKGAAEPAPQVTAESTM
jgi:hypothetical protein